jgi:Flp pilus assembly protein TadD
LELTPSFALAHYGLGIALMFHGQAAEAVPELEMAARLSPHDPYMWLFEMNRAAAHIALGQFEDAERLARSAIRRPGAGFWAYAHLASALGHLGRIEEARPALDKLLELKPEFSPEFFDSVWIGVDRSFTTPFFEGLRKAGLDVPDEAAGG